MKTVKDPKSFRENVVNSIEKSITNNDKDKIVSINKSINKSKNKSILSKRSIENIEKGIYNFCIQTATKSFIVKKWDNPYFVLLYVNKLRVILANINNDGLLESIISKKIKSHEIANMTHQELDPDKWKERLELKKLHDENLYSPKLDANTDDFTCRKCKSKKCSYYQLQTRSADEPMTTFVTCIDCGNRWKC